jgi:hypothetical protein
VPPAGVADRLWLMGPFLVSPARPAASFVVPGYPRKPYSEYPDDIFGTHRPSPMVYLDDELKSELTGWWTTRVENLKVG